MIRWPIILAVLFPIGIGAALFLRIWIYGDDALQKPDGDLSDPRDLSLTKLRLDEPVRPDPRDKQLPL